MTAREIILVPGTVVDDRYKVKRLIAQGGMSIVYEVEDTRLGGTMALKQMREIVALDGERELMLNQFKREAEVLSRLAHLNLPRVTDYFVWEDDRCLVQELIEGKTLEEVMDEQSPRSEEEVAGWALQMCDALSYLHRQNMVYRDLKPSNVILTPRGTLKLIDFGLIRFFAMGKPRDTVIMGTPGFAAPEQYGQGETDPRSDVFSLGVLLHHLLTGHDPTSTPFVFPDLRSLNSAISDDSEQVIYKALALDPAARFQSIDDMAKAIRGERAVIEEAETFTYGDVKPSAKEYGLSAGAAAAGAALGIFYLLKDPMAAVFPLFALLYAPFWLWLLGRDYARKMKESLTVIIVTDSGLHYRDGERRLFVKWDEIKALKFVNDRFAQAKKAVIDTVKGSVSFVAEGRKESSSFLALDTLSGSDRLCQIVMKQARLAIEQPGREVYRRR